MTTLRVLAITVLAGVLMAGCGDDERSAKSESPSSDKKQSDTEPTFEAGPMDGPTGEVVRAQLLLLSATDFDAPPPERLGFEFGTKAGRCTNVDPAPERAGLIAAVKASATDAAEVDLSNPEVLVADCGDMHAAVAKWGSAETQISIDEFTRTGDGDWASTTGDHYPPCGLPEDARVLWKLEEISC